MSVVKSNQANVTIDNLRLVLPASLGERQLMISRLLKSELQRLNWPSSASIKTLSVPSLTLSAQQTNLTIARSIARQIHRGTVQQVRQGKA